MFVTMHRFMIVVLAFAAGCGGTVAITATSTPLADCPMPPYQIGVLPPRVANEPVEPGSVDLDEFTAIGGTRSIFWVDSEAKVAVALIRGTLPPQDFPGEKGEVEVAGQRAVAGAFPDGKWVVAWYEGDGTRCDLFTMVFYPPVEATEVEATIGSMERAP
jgi:CubicO group peptidase (beta-lactamase class C family)